MAEKMEEHIYIIPLREARRMPRWKRSNGAIKDIRKYLAKHMKSEDVKTRPGHQREGMGTGQPEAAIQDPCPCHEDGGRAGSG